MEVPGMEAPSWPSPTGAVRARTGSRHGLQPIGFTSIFTWPGDPTSSRSALSRRHRHHHERARPHDNHHDREQDRRLRRDRYGRGARHLHDAPRRSLHHGLADGTSAPGWTPRRPRDPDSDAAATAVRPSRQSGWPSARYISVNCALIGRSRSCPSGSLSVNHRRYRVCSVPSLAIRAKLAWTSAANCGSSRR